MKNVLTEVEILNRIEMKLIFETSYVIELISTLRFEKGLEIEIKIKIAIRIVITDKVWNEIETNVEFSIEDSKNSNRNSESKLKTFTS